MSTQFAVGSRPVLYEHLIDPSLFSRIRARIQREEGMSEEAAGHVVDAALGFLKMCADHPEQGFSPSPTVDLGWHTFILYTRGYAEFCDAYAGRFIHHEPNDNADRPSTVPGFGGTIEFMRREGVPFDFATWTAHLATEPRNPDLGAAILEGGMEFPVDCDGGKGCPGGGGPGGCS